MFIWERSETAISHGLYTYLKKNQRNADIAEDVSHVSRIEAVAANTCNIKLAYTRMHVLLLIA